ncbi:MAG: TonB family protein [Caulobacteraceae bacterium]|nr:TonB family protein [Caulobacteraceae bacterium]
MRSKLALALAVCVAGPVLAQAPESSNSVISPAWAAQPSPETIRAGWPKSLGAESAAFAVLTCTVDADGALADCRSVYESPRSLGVANAALALAGQYRPLRQKGTQVLFPVVFNPDRPRLDQAASGDPGLLRSIVAALTRPVRTTPSLTIIGCQVADNGAVQGCQTAYETVIDPELAAYQLSEATAEAYGPAIRPHPLSYQTVYRVMTDNTDRPAAELANAPMLDAFYPARAQAGVAGRVKLDCTVTGAGLAKDCEVASETPEGQGFANAALEYAGRSTYLPKRIDGVELEDQITLDIRLEPGQEGAAPAAVSAPVPPADPLTAAGPTS